MDGRPQVPAASQVLRVLRWLAGQAAPVPAAAVSRALGLPRSTTYHLLAELCDQGFVVHLPEQRRYGLGVSAYELGYGWTRQASLERVGREPMRRLVRSSGCTAHLAVLHGREVVYVIEERFSGSAPLVSDVGVRLPAHLTATGRASLAALPSAHVRALFPDAASFVLRHDSGPTSLSELRRLLVDVRRRGYAVEQGEVTPGYASVAVAVLDAAGHPAAAVAVTYADNGHRDHEHHAAEVRVVAGELQQRLGGG